MSNCCDFRKCIKIATNEITLHNPICDRVNSAAGDTTLYFCDKHNKFVVEILMAVTE